MLEGIEWFGVEAWLLVKMAAVAALAVLVCWQLRKPARREYPFDEDRVRHRDDWGDDGED